VSHARAGTGVNPASPAVKVARARCKKLLPGGVPPAHASEQEKEQLVAESACMRGHGVPVPRTINVNSPAFEQAAKTCNVH
jgi:hypothetical protein